MSKISPVVILGLAGVAFFMFSGAAMGGFSSGGNKPLTAAQRKSLLLAALQDLEARRKVLLAKTPTAAVYAALAENKKKTRAILTKLGAMIPDGF